MVNGIQENLFYLFISEKLSVKSSFRRINTRSASGYILWILMFSLRVFVFTPGINKCSRYLDCDEAASSGSEKWSAWNLPAGGDSTGYGAYKWP